MNTVFQEGDLVYSFADESFYVIIEVFGDMAFEVYTMNGENLQVIDVTLTHINNLVYYQCEIDNKFYYNKNKE